MKTMNELREEFNFAKARFETAQAAKIAAMKVLEAEMQKHFEEMGRISDEIRKVGKGE